MFSVRLVFLLLQFRVFDHKSANKDNRYIGRRGRAILPGRLNNERLLEAVNISGDTVEHGTSKATAGAGCTAAPPSRSTMK